MEKSYNMKYNFSYKLAIISFVGNMIIALGVSTCGLAQMGIDPFTSMNTGVSNVLNLSLGIYQASFNLILFIILIIMNKKNLKYLNIGAIINMFILGFMVQFFNGLYSQIFAVELISHFIDKLIILIIGVLLLTLGCSLYITSDLGTGCYDALSIYMSEILPVKYAICRVITDCVCVFISFIFGGPLGMTTIILMFFTGPFISTWNQYFSQPLMNRINKDYKI